MIEKYSFYHNWVAMNLEQFCFCCLHCTCKYFTTCKWQDRFKLLACGKGFADGSTERFMSSTGILRLLLGSDIEKYDAQHRVPGQQPSLCAPEVLP